MKTPKLSLREELRYFTERAWFYGGTKGPIKAVRARRAARDRVIKFYSIRGYYLGEVYGASVSDVDETAIRSEIFNSAGEYK